MTPAITTLVQNLTGLPVEWPEFLDLISAAAMVRVASEQSNNLPESLRKEREGWKPQQVLQAFATQLQTAVARLDHFIQQKQLFDNYLARVKNSLSPQEQNLTQQWSRALEKLVTILSKEWSRLGKDATLPDLLQEYQPGKPSLQLSDKDRKELAPIAPYLIPQIQQLLGLSKIK